MKPDSHQDMLDENLRRLLRSAAGQDSGGFQERLQNAVRTEVGKQRSTIVTRCVFRGLPAAAAVVVLACVLLGRRAQSVGEVRPIYGAVEVVDSGSSRTVATSERVYAAQSIRTLSGSKAQVVLGDNTTATMAPRAVLQVADGRKGPTITLHEGAVEVRSARQRPGRALVVDTPGARIRTLGTVFDVRLTRKPDGSRRTGVVVRSGLVEFESAGGKVLLPPNTEGFADEGQSPERHFTGFELNEVLELLRKNRELARQLGKRAGLPAVIEFQDGGTAAVWTIVKHEDLRKTGQTELSLRLKGPASGAKLVTLDGRRVPVRAQGRDLRIDASALDPDLPAGGRLILELRRVKGVFQSKTDDEIRFTAPGGGSDVVTLLQFHLPDHAHIERVLPEPLEVTRKFDKLMITIPTDAERFTVWQ